MLTSDTIVAISSAAGISARAILRLSGPGAFALAGAVFRPTAGELLADIKGFRWCGGLLRIASHAVDLPARAYVFRSPRSYTRQDLIEFHLPGSPVLATALVEELIAAGARRAEAGEFTARAFLSGRLDLAAAQAVADVIDAADDAQLRAAVSAMGGRVTRLCDQAAGQITDVLATVEASVDFADEEIRLASPCELVRRLELLTGDLEEVSAIAAGIGEAAHNPRVVLAGAPNVGKSSLLNALSGTDRAIVSALAGTTRDVLNATAEIQGWAVIVQDAAGFAPPKDPLEAAADNAARRAVAAADAVLLVVDAAAEPGQGDLDLLAEIRQSNRRSPILCVANKIDLLPPNQAVSAAEKVAVALGMPALAVSAKAGLGLDALRSELARQLSLCADRGGQTLGLHERYRRHFLAAAEALARTGRLLGQASDVADVAELAAIELRSALADLAVVSPSGQAAVTEEVLSRIFARFCIGK